MKMGDPKSRLMICKSCIYLKFPLDICSKCGCFVQLKVKLKQATCPEGKW